MALMELFTQTALLCFNAGNFCSMTAILLALHHPSVRGLERTWSRLSLECWDTIERLEQYAFDCVMSRQEGYSWKIWQECHQYQQQQEQQKLEQNQQLRCEILPLPFIPCFLMHLVNISVTEAMKSSSPLVSKTLINVERWRLVSLAVDSIKSCAETATVTMKFFPLKSDALYQHLNQNNSAIIPIVNDSFEK